MRLKMNVRPGMLMASFALVCMHCAPPSSRHTTKITAPPGAGGAGGIRTQGGGLGGTGNGACSTTAQQVGASTTLAQNNAQNKNRTQTSQQDLSQVINQALTSAPAIPIAQIAAGTYSLTQLVSNFETQDPSGGTFDLVQKFNTAYVPKGNGQVNLSCVSNQYSGKTGFPMDAAGREFKFEGQFTINPTLSSGKVTSSSSFLLQQIGKTGPTGAVNTNVNDPQMANVQGILSQIDSATAQQNNNGAYVISNNNGALQTMVTIQQLQAGTIQLIVLLDETATRPTISRQFILTYQLGQQQAQPQPQPQPQQNQQQQTQPQQQQQQVTPDPTLSGTGGFSTGA